LTLIHRQQALAAEHARRRSWVANNRPCIHSPETIKLGWGIATLSWTDYSILAASIAFAGVALLSRTFQKRCRTTLSRTRFWLSYPFVMAAYQRRRRRDQNEIIPPLWISPSELISRDLDLYVTDEGKNKIDGKFIDDLVRSRDETLAIIKKQIIISSLIFLFLFSNYLSIGIDISIGGFSLKYAKGIPEGLLLISSLLSVYTLLLQSNVYLMDAAIKFFIRTVLPAELQQLYLIRYFSHENFGGYAPFNLPHITQSPMTSSLKKYTAFACLLLLVPTYFIYFYCYVLLIVDLWSAARVGIWSKAIAAYITASGVVGALFLIITRLKLRYLDYTVNNEIELLKQVAPERVNARLQEIYGKINADRAQMIKRGYLKE
jgi:hypothetical protein